MLEQIIHIIFVIWWQWKSLLLHQDFHYCAKLKLGNDQHLGRPLTDDFGHHGPNAGRQGSKLLL